MIEKPLAGNPKQQATSAEGCTTSKRDYLGKSPYHH
jgi:hypothetical protein